MKKYLSILLLLFMLAKIGIAQNTWVRKADFSGGYREGAASFSIGSKGYIGTGWVSVNDLRNDFWEYDQLTDTWSQKADFGGTPRQGAVGFSIGLKGYIGTGGDMGGVRNDFWEYDPLTNSWLQKASFIGASRASAIGFSIGSSGYIGTGETANNIRNDFYEYNQSTNIWTQKSSLGGVARKASVGFSIGNKGYIGTGDTSYSNYFATTNDFWEYDPSSNSWNQKTDFGGRGRLLATGFSIGDKGYIGTGTDSTAVESDFWEYDTAQNTWTQKIDFGGYSRYYATGFSIGNKGYIGTGTSSYDFWEFAPDSEITFANETKNLNYFTLSPNPTSSTFTITTTAQLQNAQVEIYNVVGEKMYSAAVNLKLQTLNLKLASGIYFIKLQSEKGSSVKKLVVE